MPGQQEIEGVVELLNERTKGFGTKIGELIVLPIYSTLPSHEQSKIFEETPPGARKVWLCRMYGVICVCVCVYEQSKIFEETPPGARKVWLCRMYGFVCVCMYVMHLCHTLRLRCLRRRRMVLVRCDYVCMHVRCVFVRV